MIKKSLIFCILPLLITSCSVPYELSQKNLSYLYESQSAFTRPSYILYHRKDTVSTLYYSYQLSDFQYSRSQQNSSYTARLNLNLYLRESYESKTVFDSLSIYLTDTLYFGHNHIVLDSIDIYTPSQGEYILGISLKDLNREQEVESIIPVIKSDLQDQQYFLARDMNGFPVFNPYLSDKQSIKITSNKFSQGTLFVRHYHRNFPIAIPPFAVDFGEPFDYKEDSIFTVALNAGSTPLLTLPQTGFYHFQPDSSIREGFTLFRFSEDFPTVKTPEDALAPLRYITTMHEFEKISSEANIKLAIDSFWLENSGNIDRAKSLIAKFYNRVQDANLHFSSYLEGWKTDRGMVYIVFGPPNHVYRGTNTENWVYGEAGYSLSLRFSFVRVNNPFSFNDYSLYRNPYFKEAWYNTVENWRR
ncbi:MAG: GWxTD domain-containing protein [Bacteroidales bacterium]